MQVSDRGHHRIDFVSDVGLRHSRQQAEAQQADNDLQQKSLHRHAPFGAA